MLAPLEKADVVLYYWMYWLFFHLYSASEFQLQKQNHRLLDNSKSLGCGPGGCERLFLVARLLSFSWELPSVVAVAACGAQDKVHFLIGWL